MINNHSQFYFFHVFNKSIAGFNIFQKENCSQHFIELLDYYNNQIIPIKYSLAKQRELYKYENLLSPNSTRLLKIICFCIMPDHYHLLIKTDATEKLSKFINDVENSYTRYFNIRFRRKGPLWQSPYKKVIIRSNEQLLHVSRYIHLNPTTKRLVNKTESWEYSSYASLINNPYWLKEVLTEISISLPIVYRQFVESNKDYQVTLRNIKRLLFE